MLDMGFEPQIRKILLDIRPDRQTVMTRSTHIIIVHVYVHRYIVFAPILYMYNVHAYNCTVYTVYKVCVCVCVCVCVVRHGLQMFADWPPVT